MADDIFQVFGLLGAVNASKDENGKPDPYKAAGIAMGLGFNSFKDIAMLGSMLLGQGAFNEEPDHLDELIPDLYGIDYDIDNEDYTIEETIGDPEITLQQDFLDCYDWREDFVDCQTYGVSPYEYDTQEEFIKAYDAAAEAHFRKIIEEYDKEQTAYEEKQKAFLAKCKLQEEEQRRQLEEENKLNLQEDLKDNNEYIYCGVKFDENSRIYHYITDDESIGVGDEVLVPVGPDKEESKAVVFSVGKCLRINAPYPFKKTKWIIKKT